MSRRLALDPGVPRKVVELWLVRVDQNRVPSCTSMKENSRVALSNHQKIMNLRLGHREVVPS